MYLIVTQVLDKDRQMKTAILKKLLVGMLVMLIAPAAFARLDSDDYNFPVAEEGTEGQRVLAEKTGEIVARPIEAILPGTTTRFI